MSKGKVCHVEVVIHDQEQVLRMIKKFSRTCKKQGLFEELQERRHFKKKSLTRKEKRENNPGTVAGTVGTSSDGKPEGKGITIVG